MQRSPRPVAAIVLAVVAVIVVGVGWFVLRARGSEPSSLAGSAARPAPPPASVSANTRSAPPDLPGAGSGSDALGSGARYPVDLEALRAELPNNRYWEDGAPTSDPDVAKARAERAERDNARLGKIQANEATVEEIHAYYADRRALSKDYLELASHVLAKQGDALPDRDRGMFELTVNLHRDRLRQIDRDEADALDRLARRRP